MINSSQQGGVLVSKSSRQPSHRPDSIVTTHPLEWLQAIIASINDGILVIDSAGIVRMVNPEYTKITGVRPDEIIGRPLLDVRPGAQLVSVLQDGHSRSGVFRSEGGVEYVVDMAPIVIDGKVVGAVSISKAMTEVHTLYQQLKKHKEKVDILEKTIGSMAKARYTFEDIIGKEGGLRTTVTMARKAAETDLPVLITGESGTGKELFAQAIHNKSTRANGPFVPVNCSAIPNELLESELFGYEEGAFTAAKRGGKVGLFELADHGTIFLDEIGDLSYHLQAKLLRVLQEKTVRRVGGTRERTVNLRIIAATNKNLDQLIRKSRFREDLYYRLSVVNLHIPPLRERKEDLLPLIYFFLGNSTVESGKPCYSISEEAINVLQSYDWPGNVRELKNAIEYATCMANDWTITVEDLPGTVPRTPKMTKKPSSTLKAKIRELELETIRATIEKYGNSTGAKKRAAQELGISLATLYNKMNSFPKS